METRLTEQQNRLQIPKEGDAWKHRHAKEIYMRIDSSKGAKALSITNRDDLFFSVALSDGNLVHTTINAKDIVILKPVGGTIIFEHDAQQ